MGSKSQKQTQSPSTASAILVVMYVAAFVAAFNENIINVALHDIMAAFSVSATTAQWLVSGYMIVTSIFTAIMAFLSGRFSTRKLLFFACGCMVAGEVLCLIAPSFSVLLPSRILQAAGSGILFPLMMNVVLSCAPREKLGLYLSLGGACITLGPAFGPVISGLMCTLFGWRAVFVVPLVGGIVVVGELIGRDPLSLLAGLGASAAILMLVFKDSIMGFVSGVQLSANDMLKVGDWIEMPKYGANGTVIEVTLNTVKVRNWDNTITTIPPYLLVSDSFQNWRGMRESGGRRVKRSINIDMTSVRFCTPEMLAKYRKIQLLKDYVEQTEEVIEKYNVENGIDNSILVNGRRQTNLGVFRAYLTAYLKSLPDVNQELTCMVRQLQPTDRGIPIELYFFCALKDWVPYEGVQADVFDHVLAIIPEFDLQVFQSPSGRDFQRILPVASEEKGA